MNNKKRRQEVEMQRLEEEKRLEQEIKRLVEKKRLEDEQKKKRLEDEQEKKRLEDEQEKKRLEDEQEKKRLEDEQEKKRLEDEQKKKRLEDEEENKRLAEVEVREAEERARARKQELEVKENVYREAETKKRDEHAFEKKCKEQFDIKLEVQESVTQVDTSDSAEKDSPKLPTSTSPTTDFNAQVVPQSASEIRVAMLESIIWIYERKEGTPWDNIRYCEVVKPLKNGTNIKTWIKYETHQKIKWIFAILPEVDGEHTIEIHCPSNERANLEIKLSNTTDNQHVIPLNKEFNSVQLFKSLEYQLNITIDQPLTKDDHVDINSIRILFYDSQSTQI